MVFRRRGSRELWVITRRKSDNNIVLHKMSSTFTQYAKRLDYAETEPMAMDENSEMITTRRSAQMYYNYDNKGLSLGLRIPYSDNKFEACYYSSCRGRNNDFGT